MLLSDNELGIGKYSHIIQPLFGQQMRSIDGRPIISFGRSSHGYDVRLSIDGFRIFSPVLADRLEIDPKRFDKKCLIAPELHEGEAGEKFYRIPPHDYALGMTVERFHLTRDIMGIAMGKSTYARSGLMVNVTPLEAEWEGKLVLELYNTTPLPLRVYVNEGIAQIYFIQSRESCRVSYADRGGKYQHQEELTTAKA